MSRKKMLKGLVALGILAAVNAPAYAMEEEIFSYGGYDIFRVQYFDEADQAGLDAVNNNFWGYKANGITVYKGLSYKYNEAMRKSLQGAFSQWAEILYRNGKNMTTPAWFVVGTSDMPRNAAAMPWVFEIDDNGNMNNCSNDYFYDVFRKGVPDEPVDLFMERLLWGMISWP